MSIYMGGQNVSGERQNVSAERIFEALRWAAIRELVSNGVDWSSRRMRWQEGWRGMNREIRDIRERGEGSWIVLSFWLGLFGAELSCISNANDSNIL